MRRAVLLSNHFLIPETRLTAMASWTNEVARRNWDDIQWRYDELSHRIAAAIHRGPVTKALAASIIDFLNPMGDFLSYDNPAGLPPRPAPDSRLGLAPGPQGALDREPLGLLRR